MDLERCADANEIRMSYPVDKYRANPPLTEESVVHTEVLTFARGCIVNHEMKCHPYATKSIVYKGYIGIFQKPLEYSNG